MRIRTTINMSDEMRETITNTAVQLGISPSAVISALLMKAGTLATKKESPWGAVKYQESTNETTWRRVHVSLSPMEYEYNLDLRKVTKLSVSLLVAMAVVQFLDELVGKLGKKMDNYHYHSYTKSHFYIETVPCWIFYWGIPPTPLTPTA